MDATRLTALRERLLVQTEILMAALERPIDPRQRFDPLAAYAALVRGLDFLSDFAEDAEAEMPLVPGVGVEMLPTEALGREDVGRAWHAQRGEAEHGAR